MNKDVLGMGNEKKGCECVRLMETESRAMIIIACIWVSLDIGDF